MSTSLGWRSHSGWAVMVVASGPRTKPEIMTRRRVELLDGSLPRQPYHEAAERPLGLREAKALIGRVERMAARYATTATRRAVTEFGISGVAIVGGGRRLPAELTTILGAHPLLHAAEGDLYEQALAEAAARCGLPVTWVRPDQVRLSVAVESAGKTLGPPWQKDHKLAAAAALSTTG